MVPIYASASGTSLVGPGISYNPRGARITATANNTSLDPITVNLPIMSPPNANKLTRVSVQCSSTDGAAITQAKLYLGRTQILDEVVSNGSSDFDFALASDARLSHSGPEGINVAFEVCFPTASASLSVFSVTLMFDS